MGFFEVGVAGAASMVDLADGAELDCLELLIGRSGLRSVGGGWSMCVVLVRIRAAFVV